MGPAIALAGGFSTPGSWALWGVLAARAIPSILYVRARLRLQRGDEINRAGVVGWHIGFLALIGMLVRVGWAPFLTVGALVVLLIRAVHGLSPRRQKSRATRIGLLEIAYGLFYVLASAIGYRMGM